MHWPIRSPEAGDATNEKPASLYQSQNPGCTRLIWSHTIQHFPWHHKNAETRIRNEEGILSCGKIEIYLIGQIYPTGTDTSPHNSLLRHISSQGRNLETFLEMVNFLGERRKKCIQTLWVMEPIFKEPRHKSLGQGTYKRKPEQTQVYKKGILTISVSCQIEPPTNTFLTMETLILCINLNTSTYLHTYIRMISFWLTVPLGISW